MNDEIPFFAVIKCGDVFLQLRHWRAITRASEEGKSEFQELNIRPICHFLSSHFPRVRGKISGGGGGHSGPFFRPTSPPIVLPFSSHSPPIFLHFTSPLDRFTLHSPRGLRTAHAALGSCQPNTVAEHAAAVDA